MGSWRSGEPDELHPTCQCGNERNAISLAERKDSSKEILFWNINGISGKKFQEVKSFLESFSIVCLCETWLRGRNDDRYLLNNHILIGQTTAKRSGNRGRFSGGMLLFMHRELESRTSLIGVPFLKSNALWLSYKLEGGDEHVLGFLYNPPQDSEYTIPDFCDQLEASLQYIQANGRGDSSILLLGDFNARTGDLQEVDSLCEGSFQQDLQMDDAECDDQQPRSSLDNTINRYGRRMIQFCRDAQLWIMNGRVNGDSEGEFTYVSYMGKSVIDYALGDKVCLARTKRFLVHTRVESDHMPVSVLVDWSEVNDEGDIDSNERENQLVSLQTVTIKRFRWMREHVDFVRSRLLLLFPFIVGLINLLCTSTNRVLDSCIILLVSVLERVIWVLLLHTRGARNSIKESSGLEEYKRKCRRYRGIAKT